METVTKQAEERRSKEDGIFSFDAHDLLKEYMAEFEKAKSSKDNDRVNELRHRIWILQDFAAGSKPNIPDSELEDFMSDLRREQQRKSATMSQNRKGTEDAFVSPQSQPTLTPSSVPIALQEKKLRKLQKKMTQTLSLKKRLLDGESLEQNQIAKINREKELQDQIDEVEEELYYRQRM